MTSPKPSPQRAPRTSDNSAPLLSEYLDLYKQHKDLERKLKDLKPSVLEMLDVDGDVTVDGATFSKTLSAGKTTLDRDAALADGVDLSLYTKTGRPSARLNIKINDEGGDN